MKRSEINAIMRDADAFIREHRFYLPPFAHWSPDEWATKGDEVREIVDRQLGWDITDFGSGDYAHTGLFMFTIRNGNPADLAKGAGKLYAEKLLISDVDQITPYHFHWHKVEDIINRGGGDLAIRLYNSTPEGKFADTDVVVSMDGVRHVLAAGSTVVLHSGNSITLTTGLYHQFWATGERALIGEVSLVNDDRSDNRFFDAPGRFPRS